MQTVRRSPYDTIHPRRKGRVMHFSTKVAEMEAALNRVSHPHELLALALAEAKKFNGHGWTLLFEDRSGQQPVRAALIRAGTEIYNHAVYEACAREQLRLSDELFLEKFWDGFIRQVPPRIATFAPKWQLLPLVPEVRSRLMLRAWVITEHRLS